MGKFTAFKEDVYPPSQLTAFPAAGAFAMESAKSLAWAAQLAYETANKPKFDRILTGWGWQRDAILDGVFSKALRFTIAGGFVAHVGQTTVVAFAGTEPEKPAQWIEDFSIRSVDGMHEGFRAGVEAVWKTQLAALIDGATEIYFCGHSLGGALCAAAAHRLCREKPEAAVKIRGVYTMGMPRVGTDQFVHENTTAHASLLTRRSANGRFVSCMARISSRTCRRRYLCSTTVTRAVRSPARRAEGLRWANQVR
jgi:hypothetical protein